MIEIIALFAIAVLSLFVIVKSADYVVAAIIRYAKKTGISDYLVGFLIVAFGTTLPDIVASVNASLSNVSSLVVGDVLGSSILDMTIVLGMMAIVGKKIKGDLSLDKKFVLRLFVLILLPFIFALDGTISRIDGGILIAVFLLYVYTLFYKEEQIGRIKQDVPFKHIGLDMLIFVIGLVALLLAGRWLIFSLVGIATIFNFPILLVGLFILSAAMTLPELVVGIKSVKKLRDKIAFGDLLGAITNNMLFVIGLSAIINPIQIYFQQALISTIYMLGTLAIGTFVIRRRTITWKHGILLVALYCVFIIAEVFI